MLNVTNKFARLRDVEMAITGSWEVQMGCLEHNDEINSIHIIKTLSTVMSIVIFAFASEPLHGVR